MAVNPENYFTGDGSRTSFEFSFQYIDETDVKVSVDGTVQPTTAYSFANAVTILFDTAPLLGQEVRIYRDTNVDELKSTFFAGSSIRAQDLNQNFEQNNFAVQEIKAYSWDNETQTIHSDETWVSSDDQIATTAAMDQRFQDEAAETILSTETWVSDDDHIATTAAIDARFQDELDETITSAETWPDNDDTIATTAAIDNRIDTAITNDIGTDGTGITVTDDGDGTITLGLAANSIDLDRIKNADIITSAEANPNNDNTIATTAKIDDMIDAAISGDISADSSGITVTDNSDGTITLSIEAGAIDFDRINPTDIITQTEQDASSVTPADTNIFTAVAAAKRFDTIVQTPTPSGSDWEIGKTWLQNDSDLTLSIWNGSTWSAITSGGTFTNQPKVVYVDASSGSDSNDGHRISRPKLTIEGALDQINAEIDVEITNGGSGYVNNTYNNVSLTHVSGTGIGTGLTATIVVSGGAVTSVTINSAATLENYSIGDVLSASTSDLGGSGSGFQLTVTGEGDGQIIVVAAGVYQEPAPLQIKRRNVSIIGQALRSCIVHPTVATQGDQSDGNHALFELNSGSYIANLTLTGMQAGSTGTNTLDSDLPTRQGWNFAFYSGAYIVKSPYIQNCTNFSDSEIDNSDLLAHRPRGGTAGDTDSAPTGGGMLVNGATPDDDSPLRSMVADSYTHVGLNGPGILVTNNGYAQITSSYAFFNKYHIKCLNGGQANLAASTTDFGDQALVADGRSTSAIFTADLSTAAGDGDITFTIDAPTAAAGWHGTATRPQGNMLVELNSITYPILSATANGSGWDVTISRPNPNNRSENLGLNGAVATPATASFFLRSMVASSGHTMEYVGSGTNYSALPENGGVPDETKQITESNNGKVWTAITDHNGKFKIGGNQTTDPIFEVDQQLGFVTIPEGSIAFNLLSDLTPQLGGNLDVNGQTITSASNGNIVIDPDGTGTISLGADTSVTGDLTVDTTTLVVDATNDRVGVNTASPTAELHIASTTTPTIKIEDSDNGFDPVQLGATNGGRDFTFVTNQDYYFNNASSTYMAIDSSGRLLVGTSTSISNDGSESALQIAKATTTSTEQGFISLSMYPGTTNRNARLYFNRSRGSAVGNNTVVAAEDRLGEIFFNGADGTKLLTAASITAVSDGTPGTDDMPGRLVFSTTADGAAAPTTRMTIDSSGNVGVATNSPTELLTVGSATVSDSYIRVNSANNTEAGIKFYGDFSAAKGYNVGYEGNGNLFFIRSDSSGTVTDRLVIDDSGNVGIGQVSPAQLLDVNGDALINGLTIGKGAGSLGGNTAIGEGVLGNATTGCINNVGVGYLALEDLTTGEQNTAVGRAAGANITTGDSNTFVGRHSGFETTIGQGNTALGEGALNQNRTGNNGTAIGRRSQLYANSQATAWNNTNVSVGFESLRGSTTPANNTGLNNTAIGYQALNSNTSGDTNTAIGHVALFDNTTGIQNVTVGGNSLVNNTTGSNNTALGFQALNNSVGGNNGVAIGLQAQFYYNNTSTAHSNTNTAVGYQSLRGSTTPADNTGLSNTAAGYQALLDNTTGTGNAALGHVALSNNTTGRYNIGIGTQALFDNTEGGYNVGIGYFTISNSTVVDQCVAIGHESQRYSDSTTTSKDGNNTSVGFRALRGSTTAADNVGINNTAVGVATLQVNSGGTSNSALGQAALLANTTGNNNVAIGVNALVRNTTGSQNSALGVDAGRYDQAGNDTANFTNCTYLGQNSRASGNNQVILGGSGTNAYLASDANLSVTSDERDKTDIRDTILGLDFINALRPVDYRWDPRDYYFDTEVYEEEVTEIVEVPNPAYVEDGDEPQYIEETVTKMVTKDRLVPVPKDGSRKRNRFHHGLIAQEVKAAADAMGIDFAGYQDHKVNGGLDKLTMGYGELIAPLIKAVQELSAENAAMKARLDALEAN